MPLKVTIFYLAFFHLFLQGMQVKVFHKPIPRIPIGIRFFI